MKYKELKIVARMTFSKNKSRDVYEVRVTDLNGEMQPHRKLYIQPLREKGLVKRADLIKPLTAWLNTEEGNNYFEENTDIMY